ncbi:hypothetical protein FVEN_g1816 [Fusarium venenatum]|nr:hypothetical protein FVEN_g1816 [Fusarium venenatum]
MPRDKHSQASLELSARRSKSRNDSYNILNKVTPMAWFLLWFRIVFVVTLGYEAISQVKPVPGRAYPISCLLVGEEEYLPGFRLRAAALQVDCNGQQPQDSYDGRNT